jgi:capsular polysaccharide biosynthesis protein
VNQGTSSSSNRNAVLVDITVQLDKKKKAEDAANAIAEVVQRTTTSRYVRQSISIYGTRIDNYTTRLKTLQQRIALLDGALKEPGLTLDQRLLLAIQLDQAQATQGQTIDSLANAQQQQILAQDVQRTQIIQEARGAATSARSHRNSILVGGLIGLIVGVIGAILVDRRSGRSAAA